MYGAETNGGGLMERGRERGRRAFAAASRPKAAGFSWYAVSDDVRWVKKKWVAWSILVAMCLSSCATADDKGVAETGSPVAEKDDTRCEVYRRSLFALNDGQWTVVGDGVRMFPCQKAICAQDDGRFDWHWVAPVHSLRPRDAILSTDVAHGGTRHRILGI